MGLHSAAIIAFQLSLMQLISIVQWHHFAFMVISIAMLGFGASGTLLALARTKLLEASTWLVPLLMIGSGMLMAVVFPISRSGFMRFDVFLLFSQGGGVFSLLLSYLLFFMPFFLGALAIGILFIKHSRQIGSFYFSNLLGSGAGGIFAVSLMAILFPVKITPIIGLLSVISGLMLINPNNKFQILATGIPAAFVGLLMLVFPGKLHLSEYKDIEKAMNLPQAVKTHRLPSVFGLTEVVYSPAQRFAPAVSFSYTNEIPGGSAIFVNGNYYGAILPITEKPEYHILNFTTQHLPFVISNPQKVLCINAGSGKAVSHALANNAAEIDAIIENRAITRLMKGELAEISGNIFLKPEVRIQNTQARTFLAASSCEKYDLIVLPLLNEFGGMAGINALREEYSYTLEAFVLMLNRLNPNGMIAVSAWLDYPPRASLKIPATLVKAAIESGIENPKKHIAAIRSWATVTFVLKNSPITDYDAMQIRQYCKKMFFDPLLLPGIDLSERQQFNMTDDQQFFSRLDMIMENNPEAFGDYSFVIAPSTDDRPYFSQFLRLRKIPAIDRVLGRDQLPFIELGYLTLLLTLVQSTLLAVILIMLPLFGLRHTHQGKTFTMIYFGALGLGYMFAEIILIQRFVLYFGQPVFAVTAVISTMMLFSGIGSSLSQKLEPKPQTIQTIAAIVSALLLVFVFVLTPLLQSTIALGISLKILISLVAIGIPAFVMGMLFPLGIRLLDQHDTSQIPWAWGINGCLSVISTALATLIAIEEGFRTVLLIASFTYLIAALVISLGLKMFAKKSNT